MFNEKEPSILFCVLWLFGMVGITVLTFLCDRKGYEECCGIWRQLKED